MWISTMLITHYAEEICHCSLKKVTVAKRAIWLHMYGSSLARLSDDTITLPEPMLTYHQALTSILVILQDVLIHLIRNIAMITLIHPRGSNATK